MVMGARAVPADSAFIIARRSASLGKTYIVIGVILSLIGILLANIEHALIGLNGIPIPSNTSGVQILTSLPLISIPIMVLATITFTTPVLLLYVYDKNNGVLEYFLSVGMDQEDIYKSYLKAALLLALILLVFEALLNVPAGLLLGTNRVLLLEESVLTLVIGLAVVSFVTIMMEAFNSLQKERIGSNQPLGLGVGVGLVMPTYLVPIAFPSLAILVDLSIAIIIAVLSLVMFFLASRLIRREKLLP